MIHNVSSQNAGSIYQNSQGGRSREASSNQEQKVPSKVEALKAAIQNGEYKVDLDALSEKMAKALS